MIVHPPTCTRQLDPFLSCSETPAWKQLISHTLAVGERISLITAIFSDHSQIELVERLSGGDAQTFTDVVDCVSPHTISRSNYKLTDVDPNLHILAIRHWMVSYQKSAGRACVTYAGFVVAKTCFRNRWQFRFVTTQQSTRCATVGQRTCGRVNIVTGKSRPRF